MDKLSKTAALKQAAEAVGTPIGSRTSWCLYVPYYPNNPSGPSGPSTEIRADSYPKIVRRRNEKIVDVALALMGFEGSAYLDDMTGSARVMLSEVLSAPDRYIVKS